MWQIINNEWKYLQRTKLFLVISIAFAMVLFLTILLGHFQNQNQLEVYNTAREHVRTQWEQLDPMNPHGAAHYGTYAFKPSNVLSSLDEGVNSITGNVIRVEGHVQNEMVFSEASQMQSISKFGKLKSALLLKYIIPLLIIFLAFNTISKEKQSGRLKLLLLQGTDAKTLVISKTLAIWSYSLLLLLLVIVSYIILNIGLLDGNILLRLTFFFLSYSLYYFIITGLTIFLASLWKNPTMALTTMLGIWILWTVFLPNILLSNAEQWHPLPSRNAFKSAMKDDRSKGIDGHNPLDERSKSLEKDVLEKYGVKTVEELPINFDGIRMQADEEYGNKVWDKHFGDIRAIIAAQKRNLQWNALYNPFIALQNSSMGFTATDNLHHQDFLIQVEHFRRRFIKALNDKHAFGGSKTGDWDWKVAGEFYKSVPDFSYKSVAAKTAVNNYLLDITILLFWSSLTLALLFYGARKLLSL